jgi:hypothetical protein
MGDRFRQFDEGIEIEEAEKEYAKELDLQKGMMFHRRVRRARMEGNTPWVTLEDCEPKQIFDLDVPLPEIHHLVTTPPPKPYLLAPFPTHNIVLQWHTTTLSDILE